MALQMGQREMSENPFHDFTEWIMTAWNVNKPPYGVVKPFAKILSRFRCQEHLIAPNRWEGPCPLLVDANHALFSKNQWMYYQQSNISFFANCQLLKKKFLIVTLLFFFCICEIFCYNIATTKILCLCQWISKISKEKT